MAKARKRKLKRPHSTPSPGRRRLKVFKTAAGFDDAFVAAPSRKAALEAWGAGTDLFSAGIAEEVREPKAGSAEATAAEAALASPGEMVRVRRGGGKEGPSPSRRKAAERRKKRDPGSGSGMTKTLKAAVAKAEGALPALEERQGAERAALAKEEEKLAGRRRALEVRQAKAREKAQAKLEAAEDKYRRALRARDA